MLLRGTALWPLLALLAWCTPAALGNTRDFGSAGRALLQRAQGVASTTTSGSECSCKGTCLSCGAVQANIDSGKGIKLECDATSGTCKIYFEEALLNKAASDVISNVRVVDGDCAAIASKNDVCAATSQINGVGTSDGETSLVYTAKADGTSCSKKVCAYIKDGSLAGVGASALPDSCEIGKSSQSNCQICPITINVNFKETTTCDDGFQCTNPGDKDRCAGAGCGTPGSSGECECKGERSDDACKKDKADGGFFGDAYSCTDEKCVATSSSKDDGGCVTELKTKKDASGDDVDICDDGIDCSAEACYAFVPESLADVLGPDLTKDDDGCLRKNRDGECPSEYPCASPVCEPISEMKPDGAVSAGEEGCYYVPNDEVDCNDGADCSTEYCEPFAPSGFAADFTAVNGCAYKFADGDCDDGATCTEDVCAPDGSGDGRRKDGSVAQGDPGCYVSPASTQDGKPVCDDGYSCSDEFCYAFPPTSGAAGYSDKDETTGCRSKLGDCPDLGTCTSSTCVAAAGDGVDPTSGCTTTYRDDDCSASAVCYDSECVGIDESGADEVSGCKDVPLEGGVCTASGGYSASCRGICEASMDGTSSACVCECAVDTDCSTVGCATCNTDVGEDEPFECQYVGEDEECTVANGDPGCCYPAADEKGTCNTQDLTCRDECAVNSDCGNTGCATCDTSASPAVCKYIGDTSCTTISGTGCCSSATGNNPGTCDTGDQTCNNNNNNNGCTFRLFCGKCGNPLQCAATGDPTSTELAALEAALKADFVSGSKSTCNQPYNSQTTFKVTAGSPPSCPINARVKCSDFVTGGVTQTVSNFAVYDVTLPAGDGDTCFTTFQSTNVPAGVDVACVTCKCNTNSKTTGSCPCAGCGTASGTCGTTGSGAVPNGDDVCTGETNL